MKKYRLPLPPKQLGEYRDRLFKLLESFQSVLILGCPGSGKSSITKYLMAKKSRTSKGFRLITFYCDRFKGSVSDAFAKSVLLELGVEPGEDTLYSLIAKLRTVIRKISETKRVVLIIENLSSLETEKCSEIIHLLSFLATFSYADNKLRMVFVDKPLIEYMDEFSLLEPLLEAHQNSFIKLPIIDKDTFSWILKRNAAVFGISSIKKRHIDTAYRVCGGLAKRAREILFIIAKHPEDSAQKLERRLLEESSIRSGVEEVMSSLSQAQQNMVLRLCNKEVRFTQTNGNKHKNLVSDLLKLGVLVKKGRDVSFFADSRFLRPCQKLPGGSKLYFNSELSGREVQLLKLLIKEAGIVTKEAVAKCMWEKEWLDKYSEWALSKAINRLSGKVASSSGQKVVKTVRGRGYIMADLE